MSADTGTQAHTGASGVSRSAGFDYLVPVDPMDDLQCDSCQ